MNRERGVSHYGISRTFRVMFDLLTIRFLLKYLSRPLHFFGRYGALSILAGWFVSLFLLWEKFVRHESIQQQHGPLMVFAAVLIVGFHGDTHALLPLYMIGVFISFTLSQTGMVIRWRRSHQPLHRAFRQNHRPLMVENAPWR